MCDERLRAWLALNRVPGVGPYKSGMLLRHFAGPQHIFTSSTAALRAAGAGAKTIAHIHAVDWAAVEQDLAWLAEADHHVLCRDSDGYPPLLAEIADPPPVLFVEGDPACLARAQVAIVGTRKPTRAGVDICAALAEALVGRGLVVTSGLALGIDAAAHRGALHGRGNTVAVAACGLDQVYPREHRELARSIRRHGALVSEFPIGMSPQRGHFPRRNRIISGLSLGVVVVEAALRSGSLTTAKHAAEQSREVFAVPGPVQSPNARGCHQLLREGASLVECVHDVLEELQLSEESTGRVCTRETSQKRDSLSIDDGLSADASTVFAAIGFEGTAADLVVQRTGLTAGAVSSMLLQLELQGLIYSAPGGLFARTSKGN